LEPSPSSREGDGESGREEAAMVRGEKGKRESPTGASKRSERDK
jgi:hypothetical protein